MPTHEEVTAAVGDKLTEAGFDPAIAHHVLAAIAEAGYCLSPACGGPPIPILETISGTKKRVHGLPGTFLISLEVGDGTVVRWVELHRHVDGRPQTIRMPL